MDLMDYVLEDVDLNTVIQEAYKGKSKQLTELEKMIGNNREKYYNSFRVGQGYYTDRDLVKIGDKIADIFGFKLVDFNIANDRAVNAFTIPCGYSMDSVFGASHGKSIVDLSGPVPKLKNKPYSCVIRCTSGLWGNREFSDGEVLAIILHEIGHNFQHEINTRLRTYASFVFFVHKIDSITSILTGHPIKGIKSFIMSDSKLRAKVNAAVKGNAIGVLVSIVGSIAGIFELILKEMKAIGDVFTFGVLKATDAMTDLLSTSGLDALVQIFLAPVRRGAENISDTFTAELGYGPELASALLKFELSPDAAATYTDSLMMKFPIIHDIRTLVGLPLYVVYNLFFAPHPLTGKRVSNIVYELESNIKNTKDLSPAMKKELQKQVDEIKEASIEYTKCDNPLSGTALSKALVRFTMNFDKDPKGFIAKHFSGNNLEESLDMMDEYDAIDLLGEGYDFLIDKES